MASRHRPRHGHRSHPYGHTHDYSTERPPRQEPGPWRDRYVPRDPERRRYDDYDDWRRHDDRYAPRDHDDRRHDAYSDRRDYRSPRRYEDDYRRDRRTDWVPSSSSARDHDPGYSDRRGSEASSTRSSWRSPPRRHETSRRPENRSQSPPTRPRKREMAPLRENTPAPPPPLHEPSPEYLALTAQEPQHLADPRDLRKLLILDLNGTLVFRSSYKPKTQRDAGAKLRASHPRPYLPSFRAYIFAPETAEWLDVMIWSSAQPHSVRGMVDRCFGLEMYERGIGEKPKGKGKEVGAGFVAIWARDTLGLSEEHYNQKVQTVKDLNIPWSKLRISSPASSAASSRSSSPVDRGNAGASSNPTSPVQSSSPLPSSQPHPSSPPPTLGRARGQPHSALSTLLLDDSPLKAVLQPYNHVCLPEYDGTKRANDLAVFTREQEQARSVAVSSNDNPDELEDKDEARKRRRREKKERKREEQRAKKAEKGEDVEEEGEYDQTLLAVIGVLEEVKLQRNVAAWIRAGGLWGPGGPPTGEKIEEQNESNAEKTEVPSDEAEMDEEGRDATKQKRAHPRGAETDEQATPSGNDPVSSTSPTKTAQSPERPASSTQEGYGDTSKSLPMWFEYPPTIAYWVERGCNALERMGIPILHGIER